MAIENILLVDDDQDLRRIAKLTLTRIGGWKVTTAVDGLDALQQLKHGTPDLVILDVMMPNLDGPSLLMRLREMPEYQDLVVVFMTAAVQSQQVAAWRSLGAAGVISKPFDVRTLPERLQELHAAATAASV